MKLFSLLRRIPVAGTLVWLANCYAYSGDPRAGAKFAPMWLWIKAFVWNFCVAGLLTLGTLPDFTISLWEHIGKGAPVLERLSGFGATPGATIISVFPNLLGLGIGIYALLFALDTSFVREMHRKLEGAKQAGTRTHGSVLVLNSDIAFPLSMMVLIVAVGVISQVFPNVLWVQLLSWFGFWYGLLLVLEIIALLFLLVDNSLLEKASNAAADLPNGTQQD
jgi:hypothetical protein